MTDGTPDTTDAKKTGVIDDAALNDLMSELRTANDTFNNCYPGLTLARQPVHTVYGGANLYKPGAAGKLASLAARHLTEYAPDAEHLATALGFAGYGSDEQPSPSDREITEKIFTRVGDKLASEAIEDHRVDFEDGYGARQDDEEDGHAVSAAEAMADGIQNETLPPFVGIRIKSLTEESKHRAIRTLQLFMSTLMTTAGQLPPNFVITLPKVTSPTQVSVLATCLDIIEARLGIAPRTISIEIMIETIQSVFGPAGELAIPALVDAGDGRVSAAILGTYDYTATCNIASTYQDHRHPAADFARQMMQVSLTGTDVSLSDGITNLMPIPPNRAAQDGELSLEQRQENSDVVHHAWRVHFDNILHSLQLGLYQGWDLNPAQIPVRYAAVYYFFLTGLEESTMRLTTFINKAAQASLSGNTFDDAATGQGLVNYFTNGINCGALTMEEAAVTGITEEELKTRSFLQIVQNRIDRGES